METENPSTESAPTVVVRKVIRARREVVFDAWTKPELMAKWYVGGEGASRSTVDLRVGGEYTNEMLLTGQHGCSEGGTFMHKGTYLEILPPERLVFTWNSPSVQNTVVTVELREVETGTEVTITHRLNSIEDCVSHQGGWSYALEQLAKIHR